eukprot:759860-Hanusia_phi.AAC.1
MMPLIPSYWLHRPHIHQVPSSHSSPGPPPGQPSAGAGSRCAGAPPGGDSAAVPGTAAVDRRDRHRHSARTVAGFGAGLHRLAPRASARQPRPRRGLRLSDASLPSESPPPG